MILAKIGPSPAAIRLAEFGPRRGRGELFIGPAQDQHRLQSRIGSSKEHDLTTKNESHLWRILGVAVVVVLVAIVAVLGLRPTQRATFRPVDGPVEAPPKCPSRSRR